MSFRWFKSGNLILHPDRQCLQDYTTQRVTGECVVKRQINEWLHGFKYLSCNLHRKGRLLK